MATRTEPVIFLDTHVVAWLFDAALEIDWTRDTFDRLIVAEAKRLNAGLVPKTG